MTKSLRMLDSGLFVHFLRGDVNMQLVLTIAVGFLGAWLGLKYRLPAGALVGSMIAVMVFNVVFDMAYMPQGLKFYTQIATGAYVGAKISRQDAMDLRHIIKPALILSAVMLVFTVSMGWLICQISHLAVPTALFAMAPAGITDMTLASMDFAYAEPSVVALIQTLRVVFTILILPPLIRRFANRTAEDEQAGSRTVPAKAKKTLEELAVTVLVALVCGWAGKKLGVPGGAIAFSMAGCAMFNIKTGHGYMPLKLRQFVQVFAGALIGTTVGRQQALQMLELWNVVLLAVVSFIVLDLIAGALIAKCTDMDPVTALFSCAPGGLTDMTLIAADLGADGVKVAGMHMIRLVSVIALYPTIIHVLVSRI